MTTTTIPVRSLPHVEIFAVIYDGEVANRKDVDPINVKARKTAFFAAYRNFYGEYGDDMSSYDYLQLLLQGESEEVRERALIEGKNLLLSEAPDEQSDNIPNKPSRSPRRLKGKSKTDDTQTPSPKMGWRERLGAKIGPKDTNQQKEEVA